MNCVPDHHHLTIQKWKQQDKDIPWQKCLDSRLNCIWDVFGSRIMSDSIKLLYHLGPNKDSLSGVADVGCHG